VNDNECPSADAEARDDSRCKSLSWAKNGTGPLLRCKLDLGHKGQHEHGGEHSRRWTDADAEDAFEPDRGEEGRCTSTIEPLGGLTVRCQDVPGHVGRHVNFGHTWTDKAQIRRGAAGAACDTINAMRGEIEEAEAEIEKLKGQNAELADALMGLYQVQPLIPKDEDARKAEAAAREALGNWKD
jgi:hypothetical protein